MQFANDITPLTLASTAKLRELHSKLSTKNTTAVLVRSAIESELYFRKPEEECFYEEAETLKRDLVSETVEEVLGAL